MKIEIKTIPHSEHRYPTVGDWWWDHDGTLQIRVSKMGNWKYEVLVALHELIEVLLCKDRGIKPKDVDNFDMQYEREREQGLHGPDEEPGWDKKAPYRKEHAFAEKIERMFARQLKVAWKRYNDKVMSLP